MPTRRAFCRRLATATAVATGATATTATRAAADHFDHQPESVTIAYDETVLRRYQPLLDLSAVEANENDTLPDVMYGWVAASPDYDTNVAVYWTKYPFQKGVFPMSADSHYGDHEPVLVEYYPSTGDVRRVWYDAYHWMKGTAYPMEVTLADDTHPTLGVISPWHNMTVTPKQPDAAEFIDLYDLGSVFEEWLAGGMEEHLKPGANVNPWLLASRAHWWRDTAAGVSVKGALVRGALHASRVPGVNIGGAAEADI
jgi:hypothetical protein